MQVSTAINQYEQYSCCWLLVGVPYYLYELSVCPRGSGVPEVHGVGIQVWDPCGGFWLGRGNLGSRVWRGSGSLEKCSSCKEFSNLTTWRGDMGQKLHF